MAAVSPGNRWSAVLAGALLAAFVGVTAYQLMPPDPVPVGADPQSFSSARAMEHVRRIAREPHPVGSAANGRVRRYLLEQLRRQGVEPEVQTARVDHRRYRGLIHNVAARLPGTANEGAVMLVAHYDSVPEGPGAADDGAAVAALLETLRALRATPPLRNDVILLFTDSEEIGRLGAKAFVAEHRWADDVAVVLNFEARGSHGVSYMFESGPGNGALVAALAEAAPRPVASSLTDEVYQRLPNDTDFTVFRAAGMRGMNFAFIDGFRRYHSPDDTVEHLDEASLQHHGTYALSLARHFGRHELDRSDDGDSVFFNVSPGMLIRYSDAWVLPLTGITVAAFAAALVVGARRRRLQLRAVVVGTMVLPLAAVGAVVLAAGAVAVIALIHPGPLLLHEGATRNSHLYAAGLVLLAAAGVTLLYGSVLRRWPADELGIGAWLWWLLALVAVAVLMPGASYLFTWPLLFGLVALLARVLLDRRSGQPTLGAVGMLVPAGPAWLLAGPTIAGLFTALRVTQYPFVMVPVVLLAGMVVPHLRRISDAVGPFAPGVLAVAGVAVVALGAAGAG